MGRSQPPKIIIIIIIIGSDMVFLPFTSYHPSLLGLLCSHQNLPFAYTVTAFIAVIYVALMCAIVVHGLWPFSWKFPTGSLDHLPS
jgi:hypothetical protein